MGGSKYGLFTVMSRTVIIWMSTLLDNFDLNQVSFEDMTSGRGTKDGN
jgi:hypothetical protein